MSSKIRSARSACLFTAIAWVGLLFPLYALGQSPALTTQTFEGREWLLDSNSAVTTSPGTPAISVRGGQGGRSAGGGRPIGHVAFAKGISLKEGAIDFEFQSSQRNPVGHNYIGVIFRVQDQLRYEVLYFRFCPGKLAGIQYASVADGTDPWQQYQQPQYVRSGVFPDKKWIKIHIELWGDRMLVYMDQEKKPVLDAVLTGKYPAGSVGFWAFPSSGEGLFRNLHVTPGRLPGAEPAQGELCTLTPPPDDPNAPARGGQGRAKQARAKQGRGGGQRRPSSQALPPMTPPTEPGSIDRTQWASREMRGPQWEMADLKANAVNNGVLQVAGREDTFRWQVIYKATALKGDFHITAQYRGNCRIGLVCADGQRGYVGLQNPVEKFGKLGIHRTGKKIEFTLNGQPIPHTTAQTTEDKPFYFGAILDSGMQCELSSIHID